MHASDELQLIAAFNKIADEKENRLRRIGYEFLVVSNRWVDIRATTQLHAENYIHGVRTALLGEVSRNYTHIDMVTKRKAVDSMPDVTKYNAHL